MAIISLRTSTLSGKLLGIHLSWTVVAVLILLVILEWRYYQEERTRLLENLHSLVNVQSSAMESALWEFDLQRLRDLLKEQSRLPYFQSGEVRGKEGEALVAMGNSILPPRSPDYRLEQPLRHKSPSGETTIGYLVVTVHDEGIRTALIQHLQNNGMVLLTLLLTLAAGTLFGVSMVIGRPLEEFRQAIGRSLEEQVQDPLHWQRKDELGNVLLAYNTMLEARYHAEVALRKGQQEALKLAEEAERARQELAQYQVGLERLVEERTVELRAAEERSRLRMEELEKFTRVAVGRELRMITLKEEINQLSRLLGRQPPYNIVE
ncbi:MAG: hypothetical protein G8345_05000 [Magnetococcales bacterium]|nr:hypothetical protein [Magnetococcales bacterium]NGZ26229.1 hypothetical protein [Magnetococcales bacterium]